MHGTSHWLGMNVHDVGGGAKFVPGVVFHERAGNLRAARCVGPHAVWLEARKIGRSSRLRFVRRLRSTKASACRIEDDLLITADGVRWMSEALPRKINEIEDFIAKARRQSE